MLNSIRFGHVILVRGNSADASESYAQRIQARLIANRIDAVVPSGVQHPTARYVLTDDTAREYRSAEHRAKSAAFGFGAGDLTGTFNTLPDVLGRLLRSNPNPIVVDVPLGSSFFNSNTASEDVQKLITDA